METIERAPNLLSSYESPIGCLKLMADPSGEYLVALWIEEQDYSDDGLVKQAIQSEQAPVFGIIRAWLDQYSAGRNPAVDDLPLRPVGSPFRQEVWSTLRQIPYGEVTTYGAIAREVASRLGRERMSAQAIGGAVGHNPISIIIPCHRVIGADGSLTGYASGLELKARLLQLEGFTSYVP